MEVSQKMEDKNHITLLLCEIWKQEQTKTHPRHRGQFGGFQRQGGYEAGKMDGNQAYSDGWLLDFWWWSRQQSCSEHRYQIIMLYTWSLYNVFILSQ